MSKFLVLVLSFLIFGTIFIFAEDGPSEDDWKDNFESTCTSYPDKCIEKDPSKAMDSNPEGCTKANPQAAFDANPQAAAKAIEGKPTMLDDSKVYDEVIKRAQGDISVVNDNPKIKQKIFLKHDIVMDGKDGLANIQSINGNTIKTDRVTFDISKHPGAILASNGDLILKKGPRISNAEVTTDAEGNVIINSKSSSKTVQGGIQGNAGFVYKGEKYFSIDGSPITIKSLSGTKFSVSGDSVGVLDLRNNQVNYAFKGEVTLTPVGVSGILHEFQKGSLIQFYKNGKKDDTLEVKKDTFVTLTRNKCSEYAGVSTCYEKYDKGLTKEEKERAKYHNPAIMGFSLKMDLENLKKEYGENEDAMKADARYQFLTDELTKNKKYQEMKPGSKALETYKDNLQSGITDYQTYIRTGKIPSHYSNDGGVDKLGALSLGLELDYETANYLKNLVIMPPTSPAGVAKAVAEIGSLNSHRGEGYATMLFNDFVKPLYDDNAESDAKTKADNIKEINGRINSPAFAFGTIAQRSELLDAEYKRLGLTFSKFEAEVK